MEWKEALTRYNRHPNLSASVLRVRLKIKRFRQIVVRPKFHEDTSKEQTENKPTSSMLVDCINSIVDHAFTHDVVSVLPSYYVTLTKTHTQT